MQRVRRWRVKWRRQTLVRASVGLMAGTPCASVRFDPAPGRWPRQAASDRLSLSGGVAALALHHASNEASEPLRAVVRQAALWTAATDIVRLPDDGLRWDDPAWELGIWVAAREDPRDQRPSARTTVELHRSTVGPVPRLVSDAASPVSLSLAVPALILAVAAEQTAEERTAVALMLEGVLGWDRHDVGLQPAQQAVAYALRYAAARLEEAGQPTPQALLEAIGAHRKLTPMAGGT
jgi:hypothetical protein